MRTPARARMIDEVFMMSGRVGRDVNLSLGSDTQVQDSQESKGSERDKKTEDVVGGECRMIGKGCFVRDAR